MRVFMIQFDRTNDYVEAETMQEAISLWQEQMVADNEGDESFLTKPPEGCFLVADLACIRRSAIKRISRLT